jgi:hypothetical protein
VFARTGVSVRCRDTTIISGKRDILRNKLLSNLLEVSAGFFLYSLAMLTSLRIKCELEDAWGRKAPFKGSIASVGIPYGGPTISSILLYPIQCHWHLFPRLRCHPALTLKSMIPREVNLMICDNKQLIRLKKMFRFLAQAYRNGYHRCKNVIYPLASLYDATLNLLLTRLQFR